RVGPLLLDPDEHRVSIGGQPIRLTSTEFRLLHYLMSKAGAILSTRTLLQQVWGYDDPAGADVVRVTIHRLRQKLGAEPHGLSVIRTVPGVGVQLSLDAG